MSFRKLLYLFTIFFTFLFMHHIYAESSKTYTVKKGDTMFSIAQETLGDGNLWPKIVELNNLKNARSLKIGQVISIPLTEAEIAAAQEQAAIQAAEEEAARLRAEAAAAAALEEEIKDEVVEDLDKVVVTAMAIQKKDATIGYSYSEVKSEAIENSTSDDPVRVLSGKVSGLQVGAEGGTSGGATNVTIRGLSSFSSGNQALIVVDGVPFSSETNSSGNFVDGDNGSSRFLDIDPSNIESVTVLKGLSATTLYGTQGRNGVILITTKSAAVENATGSLAKPSFSITQTFTTLKPSSKPSYQNKFGNGFDQSFGWFFSNWGPSFEKEGVAGWKNQPSINGTDSGTEGFLEHPYTTAFPVTGIPAVINQLGIESDELYEWKAYPDPYKSVLGDDGFSSKTSINIQGASKDLGYNLTISRLNEDNWLPENNLKKTAGSFGGFLNVTDKFKVKSSVNVSQASVKSPPIAAGYGSNVGGESASVFANIIYTPRSTDLMGLPYQNPNTGESIYYRQNNSIQHPLWTINNSSTSQETDRFYGNTEFQYAVSDELTSIFRFGYDLYNEHNQVYTNKGAKSGSVKYRSGILYDYTNQKRLLNYNFLLNHSTMLTDSISLDSIVGTDLLQERFIQTGIDSSDQVVFNTLKHFNFKNYNPLEYEEEKETFGVYHSFEFGYNDYLFLNFSGRYDWVSNIFENEIYYPGASLSIIASDIFSDFFETNKNIISFLKLKSSYGSSATFPDAYPVSSSINFDVKDFVINGENIVSNTSNPQLGNQKLEPELLTELEFGFDTTLFNDRLNLEVTTFKRDTENLIVSRPLDPATGYERTLTNVGSVESSGLEIEFSTDVLQDYNGLSWTLFGNYTSTDSETIDLGQDTDQIVYAGFDDRGNIAIPGKPLTSIYGRTLNRHENGQPIVLASGSYQQGDTDIIGDANPDFFVSLTNEFSYKDLSLSVKWDYQHGGDILSYSAATLLGRGLTTSTTDAVDRTQAFILPGVDIKGNPNTKMINNSTLFFSNILYGPDEMLMYDASYLKLSEIALRYKVPKKFFETFTPFEKLTLSLVANNLWIKTFNIPDDLGVDPSQLRGLGVGNGRGFDYIQGPGTQSIGLSLKAEF